MSLDELKEKYHGGKDQSNEAFDELCGLVDNLFVSCNTNKPYKVPIDVKHSSTIYSISNLFLFH